MLKPVAGVRDEVLKRCAPDQIDLETITKVFTSLTVVDQIVFVRFDTPPENPIWGEFARWSRQPGVYHPSETIVEIRYANHLVEKPDWLRFIICKELCHSLDVSDGAHDVSASAMSSLINSFALLSANNFPKLGPVMRSELLAEVAALELLCPIQTRKDIIAKSGNPAETDLAMLAKQFCVPLEYMRCAFLPEQIQAVGWLLEN